MIYNVRLHHAIILMIITYIIGINTGYIAGELNTMKVAIKHKSARYNPYVGKFEWLELVKENNNER